MLSAGSFNVPPFQASGRDSSLLVLQHRMNLGEREVNSHILGSQCGDSDTSAVYFRRSNTYWRWGRCPWGTVPPQKPGHRFSETHNLKWKTHTILYTCLQKWMVTYEHTKYCEFRSPLWRLTTFWFKTNTAVISCCPLMVMLRHHKFLWAADSKTVKTMINFFYIMFPSTTQNSRHAAVTVGQGLPVLDYD